MINGNQLYELAQIREQEYMSHGLRRSGGRNRIQATRLVAGATRRLRRRGPAQD
jgi:hypothetical protein